MTEFEKDIKKLYRSGLLSDKARDELLKRLELDALDAKAELKKSVLELTEKQTEKLNTVFNLLIA